MSDYPMLISNKLHSFRNFAAREPAKPLNDAQMCGSFLFLWVYGNKNSVHKNILHTPRVSAATQNQRYGDNR